MIPNLVNEVEAARQKYPEAWRNAHTGNAQTEDFIRLCVRDIRAKHGHRWGLNGKRGNPNDISDDIIANQGEGTAVDVTNGNSPMEIIDVIGGAGGPNPQPVWNPGPGGLGDRGAFVGTFSVPDVGGGTPAPGPGPDPCTACKTELAALKANSVPKVGYPGDAVWDEFGRVYESDVRRAGQTLNAQSFRWAGRTIHDDYMEGLTLEASIAKHRREWCDILGIPVVN
jgi:hypothetical protein